MSDMELLKAMACFLANQQAPFPPPPPLPCPNIFLMNVSSGSVKPIVMLHEAVKLNTDDRSTAPVHSHMICLNPHYDSDSPQLDSLSLLCRLCQ